MLSVLYTHVFHSKFPVFGVSSKLEPIVISNFRFFRHAEDVLNEGYQAVSRLIEIMCCKLVTH